MRRTLRLATALACLAPAHAALAQSSATPDLRVEPCTIPGVGAGRCGTLQVWENRTARSGRKIPLRFMVIPATGTASKDPVVPLAGGPGQAVTEAAAGVGQELRALRDTRDILLADQRGSGGSGPLNCELYGPALNDFLGDFFPADRVRKCAGEWNGKADVGQYTTINSADDLDELRAALGYERLNLYGISYGTRLALEYMRRHPAHVRAAILHGVVPPDARVPLHTAPDAQRAIDGVLGECAREAACNAAYPALGDDLRVVVARLAAAPARVTVMHPQSGAPAEILLSRDLLVEGLRYMTYGASSASLLPAVLHQAARGDLGPAAEMALFTRREIVNAGSNGLYLSSTCSEDLPFFSTEEGQRLAQGSFLGDYRVRNQKAACAEWPVAPVARTFMEPVRSDAPVLILTGQWDPATPPHQGDQALRTLPNGRHLVVPSAGHGFDGITGVQDCITPLVVRFIRTADAKGLDASCVSTLHRPPFPVRALATTPVEVPAAELAEYVGVFSGPGGFRTETKLVDGKLHWQLPGNREFALVGVGQGRFRLMGVPHVTITFTREGGAVKGFTIVEGGAEPEVHTKQ